MEHRKLMIITLLSGVTAVLLGAFGAHALKPYLDEVGQANFQTANRYHFYHTFLALFYILWNVNARVVRLGSKSALIGIILFCGSLYLLALRSHFPDIPSWIGAITPIGGLLFVLAWGVGLRHLLLKSKI